MRCHKLKEWVDMKNFYIVVSVVVESTSIYEPGGNCAYMVKFTSSDNLKSVLDRIRGLKAANMCATKKEAKELVEIWNEAYKQNGTYAFDNPTF